MKPLYYIIIAALTLTWISVPADAFSQVNMQENFSIRYFRFYDEGIFIDPISRDETRFLDSYYLTFWDEDNQTVYQYRLIQNGNVTEEGDLSYHWNLPEEEYDYSITYLVTSYSNDTQSVKKIIKYYYNFRLLRMEVYNNRDILLNYTDYTYDRNSRLIETTFRNNQGDFEIKNNVYFSDGRLNYTYNRTSMGRRWLYYDFASAGIMSIIKEEILNNSFDEMIERYIDNRIVSKEFYHNHKLMRVHYLDAEHRPSRVEFFNDQQQLTEILYVYYQINASILQNYHIYNYTRRQTIPIQICALSDTNNNLLMIEFDWNRYSELNVFADSSFFSELNINRQMQDNPESANRIVKVFEDSRLSHQLEYLNGDLLRTIYYYENSEEIINNF